MHGNCGMEVRMQRGVCACKGMHGGHEMVNRHAGWCNRASQCRLYAALLCVPRAVINAVACRVYAAAACCATAGAACRGARIRGNVGARVRYSWPWRRPMPAWRPSRGITHLAACCTGVRVALLSAR